MDKLHKKITHYFSRHFLKSKHPYKVFGIFAVITYPGYYLAWVFIDPIGYESLLMRAIAVILCMPLIWANKWPIALKKYINFYWYLTLTYCLPMLFTFLLFKNNFSSQSILNTFTVLVLSILLLEVVPLIIVLFIGSILGWVLFFITTPVLHYPNVDYKTIALAYMTVILFGTIFSQKRSALHKERLAGMMLVSGSIAHELRTPLTTIDMQAKNIKKFFPALLVGYRRAKEKHLIDPVLRESRLAGLHESAQIIEFESNASLHFIDMLLVNIKQHTFEQSTDKYSIVQCIEAALSRYPFQPGQRKKVYFDSRQDFYFKGDALLICHVFLNLIKNAIYYICADTKKDAAIFIRVETQAVHRVYFRDTGQGIDEKDLPHVFDQFFSRTYHGAGVGLAFCQLVMKSIGGDISCRSVKGHFTEFILHFPVT